jgi:hypothetical protein
MKKINKKIGIALVILGSIAAIIYYFWDKIKPVLLNNNIIPNNTNTTSLEQLNTIYTVSTITVRPGVRGNLVVSIKAPRPSPDEITTSHVKLSNMNPFNGEYLIISKWLDADGNVGSIYVDSDAATVKVVNSTEYKNIGKIELL